MSLLKSITKRVLDSQMEMKGIKNHDGRIKKLKKKKKQNGQVSKCYVLEEIKKISDDVDVPSRK